MLCLLAPSSEARNAGEFEISKYNAVSNGGCVSMTQPIQKITIVHSFAKTPLFEFSAL